MGPSQRRITRLTLDNLSDLPAPCRVCTFWELDPVSRARTEAEEQGACAKEAWVSRVLLEWGSCGRVAYVDGEPAGYALYAPPAFVPGAASFPTAPAGEDAVLLATVRVEDEYAGSGLGRELVRAVVKDVINRGGVRAIEAFGGRTTAAGTSCVVPADFLVRVGFKTQRTHPLHPRLRMDLRSVVTWREEVEQALEKILDVVRPRPVAPGVERTRPGPGEAPAG